MELSVKQQPDVKKQALVYGKWALVIFIVLINLYADVRMYMNGDIAYPLLDIILVGIGLYVFLNKKMYAQRYTFPSVAGMTAFIIFPMVYTLWISITNYSGEHVMTVEGAMQYHLQKVYQEEGASYALKLLPQGNDKYVIYLSRDAVAYKSEPQDFKVLSKIAPNDLKTMDIQMTPATAEDGALPAAPMKDLMANRQLLRSLTFALSDKGTKLTMSGVREVSSQSPKFMPAPKGVTLENGMKAEVDNALFDRQIGKLFLPNMETGFYQYVDDKGAFEGEGMAPGFKVNVGFTNYVKFLTNENIRMPFLQIFLWTVFFAGFTVFITLAIGMLLACLVQWQFLRFRGIYRVLLILPYAVPAFISILVFKGLFNQNFGEINMFLQAILGPIWNLFGAEWTNPEWFTNQWYARGMILIVNAWLGYPYMMILCMGLLKSIPDDLYEATAMEGATPWINLRYITVPLLLKPLAPLLIASFAFNFNNFVLIQLLTRGGPDIIEATAAPAGYTDLLVSFTYRIAFEGGKGNDYALASAVAAVIFIMVGFMSLLQLKLIKKNENQEW